MPPEADVVRLRHMLDAARDAIEFAHGRERADLDRDRMVLLSIVKCLEIIGEAAHRVTAETRSTINTLPWQDVIGMRHRLIHAYYDVDRDVVWNTVTGDLPALRDALHAWLETNA